MTLPATFNGLDLLLVALVLVGCAVIAYARRRAREAEAERPLLDLGRERERELFGHPLDPTLDVARDVRDTFDRLPYRRAR